MPVSRTKVDDFMALWKPLCENKDTLRTFESIAKEHIICADKLVLAPNFYCSMATVCYLLTKSFNFQKHGILIVRRICVLTAYLTLDK